MAAARFVQAQLIELRLNLDANLIRAVWGGINMTYWHTMNRLDEKTLAAINLQVDSAFDPYIRRWQNVEPVRSVLEFACETIKDAALVALDVPWPGDENVESHVGVVRRNLMELFDKKYWPVISDAMLDATPSVIKVQRAWRRLSADPSHPVCRRRLLREFEALSNDLETLTV
jgi:hypothetical protein